MTSNKQFDINAVWYTGGGIFVYFGTFNDGTWFTYSDTEVVASVFNADPMEPDEEFDNKGFNPDWADEHIISATDYYFPIAILEKCIGLYEQRKGEFDFQISPEDAKARIEEQNEQIRWEKEHEAE